MILRGIHIQHQNLKGFLLWKGRMHCEGWFCSPGDFFFLEKTQKTFVFHFIEKMEGDLAISPLQNLQVI
jgi:hypothetical protein